MKRFVTKLTGILLVLAMSCAVFAACDAADSPEAEAPDMNLASPYYPEENGIISPNSQSSVIETPFVKAQQDAISTFSADVDTASYTLFRKHVQLGYKWSQMTQDYVGGNIRTEEMLNYFDYDYQEPAEGELFGVSAQIVPALGMQTTAF